MSQQAASPSTEPPMAKKSRRSSEFARAWVEQSFNHRNAPRLLMQPTPSRARGCWIGREMASEFSRVLSDRMHVCGVVSRRMRLCPVINPHWLPQGSRSQKGQCKTRAYTSECFTGTWWCVLDHLHTEEPPSGTRKVCSFLSKQWENTHNDGSTSTLEEHANARILSRTYGQKRPFAVFHRALRTLFAKATAYGVLHCTSPPARPHVP
ncbi:hypothetical protein NUW54_g12789 [Trametes sanguinea]|uniref:Uncharacterized protein n=1 Tax=Trametes sanguinea TaxID=158606 RepID=A0ACC1MU21_9APHY|nr:hypothetical protein NUW54_g12789 [Trametes sanguinea]